MNATRSLHVRILPAVDDDFRFDLAFRKRHREGTDFVVVAPRLLIEFLNLKGEKYRKFSVGDLRRQAKANASPQALPFERIHHFCMASLS